MAQSPLLSDAHNLLHLYGPLCRSLLAVVEHNLIQSAEGGRQLGKLLYGMEQARSGHLHRGGHVVFILVGRFIVSPSKGLLGEDNTI